MKTMTQILDETIEFYSEDPDRRSMETSGKCYYWHDFAEEYGMNPDEHDIKQCAVGRCITNGQAVPQGDICSVFNLVTFKKEYTGHSVRFWSALQRLHDSSMNWNEKGLSNTGIYLVDEIRELITKLEAGELS